MKLSAIILAAGMSIRMGSENKLLLKHKQSSLINETIDHISKANGIDEIIVVLGHEADLVKQQILNSQVNFTVNQHYVTGQTSSIQTGIQASNVQTEGFMICLGDMPFIQTVDYESLINFWNQTGKGFIIRPRVNDLPGHPVIFDALYKNDILSETHPDGCRTVVSKYKEKCVEFKTTNHHYLIDIDKPGDKDKLS